MSCSAEGDTSQGRWCLQPRAAAFRRRSWKPTRISAWRTACLAVREARLPRLPDPRPGRREVPGDRASRTGRAGNPTRRRPASFDLPAEGPLLLVYGGSQGARRLNELVVDTFGEEGPLILHLAGERDSRSSGRVSRRDGYRLLAYTHHFGAALAAADLALARAGGSVYELAAAGVPAVLVPYPHATADHQTKNALHFERAGAAVLVAEAELGRVPGLVMLAPRGRLPT